MLIIVCHLILIIKKNSFWLLGKGPTDGINGSTGAAEKIFSIVFSKAKTRFCLSLNFTFWWELLVCK